VRLIVLLLVSLALPLASGCDRQKAPEPQASAEAESAKGLDRSHKGEPAPVVKFKDPDGGEFNLAAFKGKPVLVNLWASWCAPCVKELPTLDKLAASHRNDGQLGVIAVSQDSGSQPSVVAFLAKLKVKDLGAYHDPKMALSGALGPDAVLPTSILIDAEGREVWRYVGDLDWTSSEAAKLLAEAKAGGKG